MCVHGLCHGRRKHVASCSRFTPPPLSPSPRTRLLALAAHTTAGAGAVCVSGGGRGLGAGAALLGAGRRLLPLAALLLCVLASRLLGGVGSCRQPGQSIECATFGASGGRRRRQAAAEQRGGDGLGGVRGIVTVTARPEHLQQRGVRKPQMRSSLALRLGIRGGFGLVDLHGLLRSGRGSSLGLHCRSFASRCTRWGCSQGAGGLQEHVAFVFDHARQRRGGRRALKRRQRGGPTSCNWLPVLCTHLRLIGSDWTALSNAKTDEGCGPKRFTGQRRPRDAAHIQLGASAGQAAREVKAQQSRRHKTGKMGPVRWGKCMGNRVREVC